MNKVPTNLDEAKQLHAMNQEKNRRHSVLAVYDFKTREYDRPFTSRNYEDGIRGFKHGVKQAGSQLANFPEDYELHALGEYDPTSGMLWALEKPIRIAGATDFNS